MRIGRVIGLAAALGAAVVLAGVGGCVNGSSSVKSSGQHISGETLSLIEAGASTEGELLDLLGAPTRTMRHHDGRTIHVYQYRFDAKASGGVFIFVAGSSRKNVERTTYFEVKDGVVTRYWTDGPGEDARQWAEENDEEMGEEEWEEVG